MSMSQMVDHARPSTPASGTGVPPVSTPSTSPSVPPSLLEEMPDVDPVAVALGNAEQAVRLRAIPYGFAGGRLLLAMLDATDLAAADEVSVTAGKPVTRIPANAEVFQDLLRATYGTTAAQMAARLGGSGDPAEDDLITNLEAIEAGDLHRMAEQPSLINLVNLVILEAIRARASDVHIEPFEKKLAV